MGILATVLLTGCGGGSSTSGTVATPTITNPITPPSLALGAARVQQMTPTELDRQGFIRGDVVAVNPSIVVPGLDDRAALGHIFHLRFGEDTTDYGTLAVTATDNEGPTRLEGEYAPPDWTLSETYKNVPIPVHLVTDGGAEIPPADGTTLTITMVE